MKMQFEGMSKTTNNKHIYIHICMHIYELYRTMCTHMHNMICMYACIVYIAQPSWASCFRPHMASTIYGITASLRIHMRSCISGRSDHPSFIKWVSGYIHHPTRTLTVFVLFAQCVHQLGFVPVTFTHNELTFIYVTFCLVVCCICNV